MGAPAAKAAVGPEAGRDRQGASRLGGGRHRDHQASEPRRQNLVHSGHELSFVLDIADLYKTEVGIPVAFDAAAASPEDVGARTRRALRDRIHELRLLDRVVTDVQRLLLPDRAAPAAFDDIDEATLQSDRGLQVAAGVNYDLKNGW